MPSTALTSLITGVSEVSDLFRAYPNGGSLGGNSITRVIGRSGTVLLCSHFERYFYAINEESAQFVTGVCGLPGHRLPESLRLVHSKAAIDILENTGWERRTAQYEDFVRTDAWLWINASVGSLQHDRILAWMKSPKPKDLVRFYKYWGINNIFQSITRKQHTRGRMWLLVGELVDTRNNIAHGDLSAQATKNDVRRYSNTVIEFCSRADRALSASLAKLTGTRRPW